MHAASLIAGHKSNSRAAIFCGGTRNELQTISQVMRVARTLWQQKTRESLRSITGASERTVDYWLAEKTMPDAAHISALLRSEHGYAFLVAIMGESDARWWRMHKMAQDLNAATRASRKLEREMERIKAARDQIELGLDG